MRLAPAVHVKQAGLQAALRHKALVEAEEVERGARVLDRVVRRRLDVQPQQVAGQEAKAQAALPLETEQVARVAQLRAPVPMSRVCPGSRVCLGSRVSMPRAAHVTIVALDIFSASPAQADSWPECRGPRRRFRLQPGRRMCGGLL